MKNKSIADNYHVIISPNWKQIWIMFDLNNGHPGIGKEKSDGKTYFWTFGTKKETLEHRRKQHKLKFHTKLSYPQKISAF